MIMIMVVSVPDLLSTFPGEDGYEMVEQLVEDLKRRGLGDAGILIPQDSQQLRVSRLLSIMSPINLLNDLNTH